MYQTLTFYHSIVRWLVLASLLYAIYRAYKGYTSNAKFSKTDNSIRHWTATIAHIQLVIGITLYTQSPIIKYFWKNFNEAIHNIDTAFFGLLHIILMLIAIILITIGSALSKRKTTDKEKYKTMLVWFSISLIIIFIAIPWPFSPLANRPYFR
jgi:Type IV secretion system pilin